MSDDRLRLVAEVTDQFTGPLDKLQTALKRTGATGVQTGKDLKKDFDGFHGSLGKATSALQGMLSPLQSLGVVGLGAGLGLGGIATALRSFSSGTQQLSILSKETGLAVNELRAFGALGERFGVSAETMQGGVKRFSEEMSQLRKRYGEAYSSLQAMNLGELVEKLVNAPNMKAALDSAMEALSNIGDPVRRRKVAEMLFGADQIGAVAGQVTGQYREMMREIQSSIGSMSKETEKAAADFEKNMSRMGNAAERLKLNVLGPLLKGLNEVIESGDRAGLRGNAEAMDKDLAGRLGAATKQRDELNKDPAKNADAIKSLDREIRNLTDAIRRSKDGAGPSGVSAIPMSYSGSGGGAARVYTASFGGGGMGGMGGGSPGLGGFGGPLPTMGGGYGGGNPNVTGGGSGRGYGSPTISPSAPIDPFQAGSPGGRRRDNFDAKASQIMPRLMRDFGLSREQAAGIVGNLGHESGGFRFHQEQNPLGGGRGGAGWAQWTGPRRRAFEAWAEKNGLDPKSDEASYGFLTQGDPEFGKALRAVKQTSTPEDASVAFENSFERAGVKAYGSRFGFARRAMNLPDADVASNDAPASARSGDKMMRRFYGDEAPTMKSGGKGSLDITLHGFPAGAKPRASMDDLFKDVNVSKSRQMETTSI